MGKKPADTKPTLMIGKDWRLVQSDEYNLLLTHRINTTRGNAKNKERWGIAGYYGTLKEALHALVKHEVRESDLSTLKSIVAKIDELHNYIDNLDIDTAKKLVLSHKVVEDGD